MKRAQVYSASRDAESKRRGTCIDKSDAEDYEDDFETSGDMRSIKDLNPAAERAGITRNEAKSWLLNGEGTEELSREIKEARKLGVEEIPWYQFNVPHVLHDAAEESAILQQHIWRERILQR